MARRKASAKAASFLFFNVTYEDGTVTSNRKVMTDKLDTSYGEKLEDLARLAIEEQDDVIAGHSGQRRARIKAVVRA